MPVDPSHLLIKICVACALLATGFAVSAEAATAVRGPGGAVRFYDDRGQDRGFLWCRQQGGRQWGGALDCNYFTIQQCQAALVNPPGGTCLQNPFSYEVPPPPVRARR